MVPLIWLRYVFFSSSDEQQGEALYSNPFDERRLQSDVEFLQSL